MRIGSSMTKRELLDFEILHLETALAALKARLDTGDPVERAAIEIDLLALYERRGDGPAPSLQ
jgi:hypothetical protein